jgi:predicted nucleic acid-binding protein
VRGIFSAIEIGGITAVTSPVTLAECITHPLKQNLPDLAQRFSDVILRGKHTRFVELGSTIALSAAQLRAQHTLTLTDALQLATAISAGCDAFLTNDVRLKRVNEIRVIVIAEFVA